MNLSEKILSENIRELREQWLTQGDAESYEEINSGAARGGTCNTFAQQVLDAIRGHEDLLEASDVELANFQVHKDFLEASDIELANFQVEEPDGLYETEGRPLDRELLKTHWPQVQPTQGLSWDDLEQLADDAGWSSGTHVWVVHQKRHYDCECPEGVANFLELPFFQRAIASWKLDREAAPAPRRPKP